MKLPRLLIHLLTLDGQVRRAFPAASLKAIEGAIAGSEATHGGQIRFVVEGALDGRPLFQGQTARERAIDLFAQLRLWDTEHNNGLLIYLLLADRAVEIVCDRGLHAHVGAATWAAVCHDMEAAFRQGDFETGALRGVQAVGGLLQQHFPATATARNDLPDAPLLM